MIATTICRQCVDIHFLCALQSRRAHQRKTVCCDRNIISYTLNISAPLCAPSFANARTACAVSLLLRKLQHSHALQRIAYRWKALALRYTMILLATPESADDRCDDSLIAKITHTCAATASLTGVTTVRAPVNGMPQI